MAPATEADLPDLLAEVNARISEYATGADASGVSWEFVCECGVVGCRERILLPLSRYEEHRQSDRPILAEGHELSRAARSLRRSQSLLEDAAALTAEARQQLSRVRQRRFGA